ncbi:MAG: metallophosphatase [Salinimicrobium sp.]
MTLTHIRHCRTTLLLCLSLFSIRSQAQEGPPTTKEKEISHTFFISANTGQSKDQEVLQSIVKNAKAAKNPGLLLVGNVTNKGGYTGTEKNKKFLKNDLLQPLKEFPGRIIFAPGTSEWNATAPQSIDDLESYLQVNNQEFWPDDGCPREREPLGDDVVIVSVDSQWYLENWDRHPDMNNKCDLNSREQFFVEFKDDLKDSQGKTVIVLVHHPVMSNLKMPFLGQITGITSQSFQNQKYRELRGRMETLASLFDDVIFVSGADKNLQYLHNGRNPQIISGAAGDETEPVRLRKDGKFASADKGYAKLIVYEDGSSRVEFYSIKNDIFEQLYSEDIARERPYLDSLDLQAYEDTALTRSASIYTPEETEKGGIYEWLWGKRYRDLYEKEIEAPVLILDSLPGNMRPIAEGGGQQSRSLRLIDDNENEFTLRALRKDPLQYIQADLVKTNVIRDFLQNTIAERFVSDYYTTAHPYAPFAVNDLSTAIDISHASPEIYFLPKQEGLGIYSEDYGGALFMLEEHVGDENKEFEIFGSPDDILSTADLLEELKENKDAYVDQEKYIRARLFDMLIGDWDRHEDQWRWAQYNENGKQRFEPIPRDRDHAFSKYDGPMIALLKSFIPLLRKMQTYDEDLKNVKWFNWSGYPLDQRFITTAGWKEWQEQVEYLQDHLDDKTIEEAFSSLPKDVQDESIDSIIEKMKGRRANLLDLARRYYDYLQNFQVITGSDEDDVFEITRKASGITEVKITSEGEVIFSNSYTSEETDEIWFYGLNGNDRFKVTGTGDDLIELKVMGGEDEDTYAFKNAKKVKLFDYKSRESIITNPDSKKWLVDSYEINKFQYQKSKHTINKLMPVADYVSDLGFTIGVKDVYTTYGLSLNPFTTQYILAANYFFASNGFKISGSAEFANLFYNWNLRLEGEYASPNYTINYFGSGNETDYDFGDNNRSYNRIKIREWQVGPALVWRNKTGASFSFKPLLESLQVDYDAANYVGENFSPENAIFDSQLYAGTEANFHFLNKNNPSYPSLGSELNITAGYKENIDSHDNKFAYVEPYFSIDYPLIPNGFAVIATKVGGEAIFGEDYKFYHAATLGGNRSLRGYRNHRFNGKRSFYHSTDLRSAVGLVRTKFIPLIIGVSAGFDYGRVWTDDGNSKKWHNDYGGGVWINGFYALTANFGYYHGDDGNRLTFTLNFKY